MGSAEAWNAVGVILVGLMIPHLTLWLRGTVSARSYGVVAIMVVTAIHVYFGLLEATQWNHPAGLQIHGLTQDVADATRQVGENTAAARFHPGDPRS